MYEKNNHSSITKIIKNHVQNVNSLSTVYCIIKHMLLLKQFTYSDKLF